MQRRRKPAIKRQALAISIALIILLGIACLASAYLGLGEKYDFILFRWFGLSRSHALYLLAALLVAALIGVLGNGYVETFHRLRAFSLALATGVNRVSGRAWSLRSFGIAAALSVGLNCLNVLLVFDGYIAAFDQHYHLASLHSNFRWSGPTLSYEGNILYNLWLTLPANPWLLPSFFLPALLDLSRSVLVQMIVLGLWQSLLAIVLLWRYRSSTAFFWATLILSSCFFWHPYLSANMITANATLGLLWREGGLFAATIAVVFASIGRRDRAIGRDAIAATVCLGLIFVAHAALMAIAPMVLIACFLMCGCLLLLSVTLWEFAAKAAVGVVTLALFAAFGQIELTSALVKNTYSAYLFGADAPRQLSTAFALLSAPRGAHGYVVATGCALLVIVGVWFGYRLHELRKYALAIALLPVALVLVFLANIFLFHFQVTIFYIELMIADFFYSFFAGIGAFLVLYFTAAKLLNAIPRLRLPLVLGPFDANEMLEGRSVSATILAVAPVLILSTAVALGQVQRQPELARWPPAVDDEAVKGLASDLQLAPGKRFSGRLLVLDQPGQPWAESVKDAMSVRVALGYDLRVDNLWTDIPWANEYGHWTSPGFAVALQSIFGSPDVSVGNERAARVVSKPDVQLAALLGVSRIAAPFPIADGRLTLLSRREIPYYHKDTAGQFDLYIYRVAAFNFGQFSPTDVLLRTSATAILQELAVPNFDGRRTAIVEQPVEHELVSAQNVSVIVQRGPTLRITADAAGWAMIVMPVDYSHCLVLTGAGSHQLIPVNLVQTGVLFHDRLEADLSLVVPYFGRGTCVRQDIARADALELRALAFKP